jgi:D-alanyl-D-alanine dipeptidase
MPESNRAQPLPLVSPPSTFRAPVPALQRARQLILVRGRGWNEAEGATVALFERTKPGDHWRQTSAAFDCTLGREGMAWGIGRHGNRPHSGQPLFKREGDARSPAGVFALHRIYGWEPAERVATLRFPYARLTTRFAGIDDPQSRHYNRLIDATRVRDKDWSSSEKVDPANPAFRWCVMVEHNWKPYPGFGSCIYLHSWHAPGQPTVGCTALAPAAL